MKNQKGIAVLETILILVIVGLIGGVGWYVWKVKTDSNKSLDSASQTEITAASKKNASPKAEDDPTKDWVSYSNTEGKFSLEHPKTWVKASNPTSCSPGLLLIGANSNSVGKCGADGPGAFGQMSVSSSEGDSANDQALSSGYTDVKKTPIIIEGISGIKYTGTASGQTEGEGIGGFEDGTKITKYVFYSNGRTYAATYVTAPAYPDVLSDFNLMVTKTLKFST